MSDTLKIANSIWPNGMKVDSDGHAVFYPLGTKKVKVPTSSTQWPKGNRLISPFVYQDDELVGFVDTKALKVFKNTAIYLPYEHIEAEFSAIEKGQLQIHAPNAITKKASWKDSGVEDIPEVQYKYKGCKTDGDVRDATYEYLADITNGTWSEPLWDLTDGEGMFYGCTALTAFSSDLPNLKDGSYMFYECYKLKSFSSDLSSLTDGAEMFAECTQLKSFSSDLSSLTDGTEMFYACTALTSFTSDSSGSPVNLSSLTDGNLMFSSCPLTSFYSDLPKLTNGNMMFMNCENLTSFNVDLPSLTDGEGMFYGCNLSQFTSDLPKLTNCNCMFVGCPLTSFSSDLPSMTDGSQMFQYCNNLTSFSSDLSSLTDGSLMFTECGNLTSFTSDLSSLTDGSLMFTECGNLTSFTSDLSSLTDGYCMFRYCHKLTTFSSDLSSLTDGGSMFHQCSNLTSFSSDLSNLTNGVSMFSRCKIDAESVMYIADTIKDITAEKQLYIDGTIPYVTLSNGVYSATRGFMSDGNYVYTYNNPKPYTTTISASSVGQLTLGINVTNNADTIKQQLEDFANEATFDSWEILKKHFVDKGWTVTFQYGGTNTSFTYGLRDGEQIIPCPIFAKLVEADKDSAQYCTEDASTFYNIEWGHDVTDTSSYTQFNSLEDAMASWNVFPKENIITTEE